MDVNPHLSRHMAEEEKADAQILILEMIYVFVPLWFVSWLSWILKADLNTNGLCLTSNHFTWWTLHLMLGGES